MRNVLDELLMLVSETADYRSDDDIRAALRDAALSLSRLRRRLEQSATRYVVAVVGLSNVGKSTLLNALLGQELAPRRNGPCTAVPIEFTYGKKLTVTASLQRNVLRRHWNCETIEEMHACLALLGDERLRASDHRVSRVVVEVPLPLLRNNLVLVDTPGFGAGQEGGAHEKVTREYLTDHASQVLWVVLAEQAIGKREKEFHDELFGKICDDLVVTGCEDFDENDRMRFEQRYAPVFGLRRPEFLFVSGLAGLKARQIGDEGELDRAGILLLERRIRQLSDRGYRLESIRSALWRITEDLGFWMQNHKSNRSPRNRLESRWRPDSLVRWRAFVANVPEAEILTQHLTS